MMVSSRLVLDDNLEKGQERRFYAAAPTSSGGLLFFVLVSSMPTITRFTQFAATPSRKGVV
jgi:hypothetical protein